MYPAPAEPCFFLTKRGFINAILYRVTQKKRAPILIILNTRGPFFFLGHPVLDCNDCSMAQWLGAKRREGSVALVLGSILVAASLVTFYYRVGQDNRIT